MLVTEGDGISDSRMDSGEGKNWASQISGRRDDMTLRALFNEELGAVLQIRTADRAAVLQTLREHGLSTCSHIIGKTRPASSKVDAGKGELQVWRDAKSVFGASLSDLHQRPRAAAGLRRRVACGGFSYGDTLGAGIGWARSITFNDSLSAQFQQFFGRSDTFGLGVCNGCQMFAELADIIPGAQDWPRFTQNQSNRFEARLSMVEVLSRPACSCRAWPAAACPSPWPTAKLCQSRFRGNADKAIASMRYVDNHGKATEQYPFNPNGSAGGPTAVTTADGRFTAMMPPRARVPQRADELDQRRQVGIQPLDARVAQRPQVAG
ncbi:Phosphoribosylformylglycinamidine synthase [Manis javanica]|nr:Phosphoribosylformylglycinamidine synthase [Manis javanica]